MKHSYSKNLCTLGCDGYSCSHCGMNLIPEDMVVECQNCAAIFCEECVAAGILDKHKCDGYDQDEDYWEPMTWQQNGSMWITTICPRR